MSFFVNVLGILQADTSWALTVLSYLGKLLFGIFG